MAAISKAGYMARLLPEFTDKFPAAGLHLAMRRA